MTVKKISTLVSTKWLKEQMMNPSAAKCYLKILDTSWSPDPDIDGYSTFYKESHIPSAIHFDLKKIQTKGQQSGHKWPIPDENVFQEYVEELGISNNSYVIAYDRNFNLPSFRTWFLFRLFGHDQVSVLDGGLVRWLMDGCHVTLEEPQPQKGEFKVKYQPQLLRNYNDMLENVTTNKEQVLDARSVGSFSLNEGHIPGSINIPYSNLFNPRDTTMKDHKELKKLFVSAGVDTYKPMVATCLTALTACGLAGAAAQLAAHQVAVYNGSFLEWRELAEPSMIKRSSSDQH